MKKYFNENFFEKWSISMAYVLGFIFADGSIFKNPRGQHYLDLTSTDLELVEKLRNCLNSDHKIGSYRPKNPRWNTRYKLQIGSRELYEDLKKRGIIERKSLVVKFPEVPKKYLGHFLRGYFDGDGSVNFGRYWRKARDNWTFQFSTSFICGSRAFLLRLHSLLKTYSLRGFICAKNRGFELVFSRHDSLALFQLMYDNVPAEMYLERKHKIFLEAFEKLNMRA